MSLAAFWDATPRETFAWLAGAAHRERMANRRAVTTAYFSEAFARTKTLNALSTELRRIFGSDDEDRQAQIEEQAEKARGFFARMKARKAVAGV